MVSSLVAPEENQDGAVYQYRKTKFLFFTAAGSVFFSSSAVPQTLVEVFGAGFQAFDMPSVSFLTHFMSSLKNGLCFRQWK